MAKGTSCSSRALNWVQTLSCIKSARKKSFCAHFQVQELAKIILARVKIKDLNVRIFYNFLLYIKPRYICCQFHKQINKKKTRRNFTCLKPAKTTLFDWTAPWKFLIFIIRFSWGETGQVTGTLFMVEFGQILPFSSTHLAFFFFADFYWDMLGHWTNIYSLCYHIVVLKKISVKLLKIALLRPYLGKNWANMGHAQDEAQFFSGNNKKRS